MVFSLRIDVVNVSFNFFIFHLLLTLGADCIGDSVSFVCPGLTPNLTKLIKANKKECGKGVSISGLNMTGPNRVCSII